MIFLYFLNHLNLPHSFRKYIFSKKQNINFTVEQENIGSLSFLNVKISCKNANFASSFYRNPTFSGVFTDYESLIPTFQRWDVSHITS